jgi:hypothetical protein
MNFTLFELVTFQLYYWWDPREETFKDFLKRLDIPDPIANSFRKVLADKKNNFYIRYNIIDKWHKENPSVTPSTATIPQNTSLIST